MPPRGVLLAADALGLACYAAAGAKRRDAVRRAYREYAEVTGQSLDPRRAARRFWRNRRLLGVGPALARYGSESLVRGLVRVDGWEHVAASLAAGRGAVLASVHAGAGGLPAAWAARMGVRVTTARTHVERYAGTVHGDHMFFGTEPVFVEANGEVDASALKAGLATLRANGIASVLCDQKFGGRGIEMTLFGRRAIYRTGFLELARLAGAPAIPAFGFLDGGRLRIEYHPGVTIAGPADIVEFVERFRALHEKRLRESPGCLSFMGFESELFCPWAAPSLANRFGPF